MKRGRTMRNLTPLQIETLTTIYYGEVYIRIVPVRLKNRSVVMVHDIIDHDGVRLTGRCHSLFKRKLLRWRNSAAFEAVVLTDAGIKEMEAIDA